MSNWFLIIELLYLLILVIVCARIIYDTNSTVKTLAYLLLAIFFPIFGIFFYFAFGINYRKRELYSKKIINDDNLWNQIKENITTYSAQTYLDADESDRPNKNLVKYLSNEMSPLTAGNTARLLINGEEKFPAVIQALEEAKDHIHIEYYIYENDKIGQTIEEILIRKLKQGVSVRFIYDDFGSWGIRKNIAIRLRNAGVETYPFYKISFLRMFNNLNYRNHRKIIIIDGQKAFVGGINVSDKYINEPANENKLFWRDTHLMIEGPGVYFLQYLFISDWNFCSGKPLENIKHYFPDGLRNNPPGDKIIQIAASGPDSINPTILYSLLYAVYQAKQEILITTPYFIPDQSLTDALIVAALAGVSVKLLVPEKSDSRLVQLAACSYYADLLAAGVKIFFYQDGFVHAKTLVVDKKLAVIGTANMDVRSFDLNFEVNAIVYDDELAASLANVFNADIKDAILLDRDTWLNRSISRKFLEKTARLVSPLL
ncbi:MAG TPA: cardiolipin synthase [Chitinophagaceae bacterium]|nr:cardiolipin synthase [Chitinophagaceae bacterium]